MPATAEFEDILDQFYRVIQLASSDSTLRHTLLDFLRMPPEHQADLVAQPMEPDNQDLKAALRLMRHPAMALMVRRYFEDN